jgi:hypothetical protein
MEGQIAARSESVIRANHGNSLKPFQGWLRIQKQIAQKRHPGTYCVLVEICYPFFG